MLNRGESVYICTATQSLKIYKAVLRGITSEIMTIIEKLCSNLH